MAMPAVLGRGKRQRFELAVAIEDDAIQVHGMQARAGTHRGADRKDFRRLRRLADHRQALGGIVRGEDRGQHQVHLRRLRIFRGRLFGLRLAEQMRGRNRLNVDALAGGGRGRRRHHEVAGVGGRATLQQQPGQLNELPGDGDDEDYSQRLRQGPRGAVHPLLSRQRLKFTQAG